MSMQPADVMAKLEGFIRATFKVAPDDPDFNHDTHLFDYGYVDSFGAVEIISFVKSEFGVEISDRDLVIHPLNTIREIGTLVHGRLAKS
jgi:methoxymalonate biosynthesis acyl carrier protein